MHLATRNTAFVKKSVIFVVNLSVEIDFSNFLKNAHVERLAEADQSELVKDIKEYYADYQAVYSNHFTFGIDKTVGEQIHAWDRKQLEKCTEQLVALLLSLKKRPVIRYEAASMMASKLAGELKDAVKKELGSGLFDFQPSELGPTQLVILDRRSDLVTPLLLQWTYQAMIHDIFGLQNGRIDLNSYQYGTNERALLLGPSAQTPKLHNLVPGHDKFFSDNMHRNFVQVSESLSALVKDYQAKTSANQRLESLAGIKKFLQEYPQMTKLSATVSKHVEIVTELQKLSQKQGLLESSELEQAIAQHSCELQAVLEMLANEHLAKPLKMKLAVLYALHGATTATFDLIAYFDRLRSTGAFTDTDIQFIDFFLKFTRHENGGDGTGTAWSSQPNISTRVDQNVYTQHVPALVGLVDSLAKGKLRTDAFPVLLLDPRDSVNSATQPCREIIVFIVGGSTYEESCHLWRYCQMVPSVKAILGGTSIQTASSLMTQIRAVQRHLSCRPSP